MDNERLNIYTYKTYHYTIIVRISYEFLLSGFEFVLGRWLPFFAETGSNHENVARHAKCPEWWVFMFSFCSQCFPPFRLHDQCFLVQKKRPNHCPIHCADVVPQAEEHWELRLVSAVLSFSISILDPSWIFSPLSFALGLRPPSAGAKQQRPEPAAATVWRQILIRSWFFFWLDFSDWLDLGLHS